MWLNNNKLTLNVLKSNFMLIGGSRRLHSFGNLTLRIEEDKIEHVGCYKYLGVISKTLSWADHVESIQKESQRLGLLHRIKHLLPRHSRQTVVNLLILLILDYGDLVWGDRDNKTLMDSVQVLHNKAAKLILNLPNRASSSQALSDLNWKPLTARYKFHRMSFVFKSFYSQGTANTFLNKYTYEIHNYSTRQGMHLRFPVCRTNWGKQVSCYLFINEWNKLLFNVSPTSTYYNFRSSFWNFYKPL